MGRFSLCNFETESGRAEEGLVHGERALFRKCSILAVSQVLAGQDCGVYSPFLTSEDHVVSFLVDISAPKKKYLTPPLPATPSQRTCAPPRPPSLGTPPLSLFPNTLLSLPPKHKKKIKNIRNVRQGLQNCSKVSFVSYL